MTPKYIKCTAVTVQGNPCQAWAIRGSDPPLCAPHSGLTGGTQGNRNALTHGFYSRRIKPGEVASLFKEAQGVDLDQESILLRVLLHRLSSYLQDPDLPIEKIQTVTPLIVSTSRALGYLKKQLPDINAIDWDSALDEISAEWGMDL